MRKAFNRARLNRLDQVIARLPVDQQLKLLASISHRLSNVAVVEDVQEIERRGYLRRLELFLQESEKVIRSA